MYGFVHKYVKKKKNKQTKNNPVIFLLISWCRKLNTSTLP